MIRSNNHIKSTQLEEERKIIEAAKKDPKFFQPLYDRYYLKIFRFVHQRVKDEATAGDLCAQVFVKALLKIKDYQHRGLPFQAWLFQVARNECNQLFRQQKHQRIVNARLDDLDSLFEEEVSNSRDESVLKELVQALNTLSRAETELIEMRFFEHRSFKEMGQILGMKENNVRVKTFRVVQKLRKQLTIKTH